MNVPSLTVNAPSLPEKRPDSVILDAVVALYIAEVDLYVPSSCCEMPNKDLILDVSLVAPTNNFDVPLEAFKFNLPSASIDASTPAVLSLAFKS